jgi:ElaB/YqjD/DUF883 family membrane-anchored ribosome-binding protein
MSDTTASQLDAKMQNVAADTGAVVDEAKDALQDAKEQGTTVVRKTIRQQLTAARGAIAEAQGAAKLKYRAAADTTDDFVHDNPWHAIGMALGAGIVVGMLIAR